MVKAKKMKKTAVDDVRAIRERLSREAGGDIRKLANESRRLLAQFKDELGLKVRKGAAPHRRSIKP